MKTTPPPHPSDLIIGAQRFFARLRTFDIECPHCGLVYRIRQDSPDLYWNPRTARFYCNISGGCGLQFTLGILAWPVGTGKGSNTPPADQVPGPRQLPQMRAEAGSWWMPDEYKHKGRPDPTNLTGQPVRPEPEDDTELQLLDTPDQAKRCLYCDQAYNPLKSQAGHPERYCSQTCEERER